MKTANMTKQDLSDLMLIEEVRGNKQISIVDIAERDISRKNILKTAIGVGLTALVLYGTARYHAKQGELQLVEQPTQETYQK